MRTSHRLLSLLALSGALVAAQAPAPERATAAAPQTRIIGGASAADTQFPYQARLTIRRGASVYLCGAAIRDATHVMTAAHCVVSGGSVASASEVTVHYGAADRSRQRVVAAYAIQPAPQYAKGDDTWDAALITLASPLAGYGSSTVAGVRLATANESSLAVAAGATATVSGWGLTEQESLPSILRSTGVTLRADSRCTSTYGSPTYAASRFVCAGGTGTAQSGNPDSCSGDSGGPLVASTASGVRLIGLVSFGPNSGCGQPGIPAAYTEVSNPSIAALLTSTTPEPPAAASNAGSAGPAPTPIPSPAAATAPPPRPAPIPEATAPARPSARIVSLRCVARRCVIRVNGEGASLVARIHRRERTCVTRRGARACRTTWKPVTSFFPRRTGNGYTVVVRLRAGRYRVAAAASNSSGARSATVKRAFRVRG